nr:hypothetical protein Iba_chr14aCG5760 [Ipomoea batatas]GMD88228.1 hypothetical protein Iba_chr14cCG5060 [Ipomoea batatas]
MNGVFLHYRTFTPIQYHPKSLGTMVKANGGITGSSCRSEQGCNKTLGECPDYELTSQADVGFSKVKTRVPNSVFVEAHSDFMFVAWNHNVFI